MDKESFFLREQDARNILNIINVLRNTKTSNESISLAINSRDGNGKTFLIKWLVDFIPKQGDCISNTLYYNAEEYDDFEDPFLPLAYNIISMIDCEKNDSLLEYTKIFLTACGYAVLKYGINNVLNIKVGEIVSQGIDAVKDTDLINMFEQFNTYFKRREYLSQKINDAIPAEGKLWVFIDELDKCKPEYAIKVLEIIKHLFNISNIIFVFSIDLDMLICALKSIYGEKFDVNAYVRHYFDYIYNPIDVDWKIYINKKIVQFSMQEVLKKTTILFIIRTFKNWKFTIREADICLNNISFFINFYKDRLESSSTSQDYLIIYIYFVMLKFKFNSDYIRILHGDYILESTHKAKFKKLDEVLCINSLIKSVLKDLANGKAKDGTSDLIKKYNLFNLEDVSDFSQNIEWVLSYR